MILVAAVLILVIAFLFYIKPVFIALILGILATVLLDKIADVFCRATDKCSSKKRKAIALVSTVAIILAAGTVVAAGAINLFNNLNTIAGSLENFSTQYNESAENLAAEIVYITSEDPTEYIYALENGSLPDNDTSYKITFDPPPDSSAGSNNSTGLLGLGNKWTSTGIIQSFLKSGSGLMHTTTDTISMLATTVFASCLIIPIMAGYYFKEKGKIRGKLVRMVPDKYKGVLDKTLKDVINDMGAFTITKILEAIVIIFLYCAGFYAVGVPHWLFAGIIMGIFNVVPYIGFIIPGIPIVVYSYTLGIEVMFAVIGIMIVIQLFDYFFILPNMVMKTVKVSSFTSVILTLAGLKLFGVFGLVFAVPLYIFCKIVMIAAYKMLVTMYPDPPDPKEAVLDEG